MQTGNKTQHLASKFVVTEAYAQTVCRYIPFAFHYRC